MRPNSGQRPVPVPAPGERIRGDQRRSPCYTAATRLLPY